MRAKVVGFQNVMIGVLGIIICLISFALVLLYKKTLVPLLELSEQTNNPEIISNGFFYKKSTCSEITLFVDSVNALLSEIIENPHETETDPERLDEKLEILINESNNLSNGIINYAQLLTDSYREVGMGREEISILKNIITDAERIAQLNKEI